MFPCGQALVPRKAAIANPKGGEWPTGGNGRHAPSHGHGHGHGHPRRRHPRHGHCPHRHCPPYPSPAGRPAASRRASRSCSGNHQPCPPPPPAAQHDASRRAAHRVQQRIPPLPRQPCPPRPAPPRYRAHRQISMIIIHIFQLTPKRHITKLSSFPKHMMSANLYVDVGALWL